jgi:hypothetical protein
MIAVQCEYVNFGTGSVYGLVGWELIRIRLAQPPERRGRRETSPQAATVPPHPPFSRRQHRPKRWPPPPKARRRLPTPPYSELFLRRSTSTAIPLSIIRSVCTNPTSRFKSSRTWIKVSIYTWGRGFSRTHTIYPEEHSSCLSKLKILILVLNGYVYPQLVQMSKSEVLPWFYNIWVVESLASLPRRHQGRNLAWDHT